MRIANQLAPGVLIRRAHVRDLKSLEALYRQFVRHVQHHYDPTLEWSPRVRRAFRRKINQAITNPRQAVFVAEAKKSNIAFMWGRVMVGPWWRKKMVIAEGIIMYVVPKYRSQQIGQTLAKTFLAWARSKNATRFQGQTDVANVRALSLYRTLGWQPYLVSIEGIIKK